MHNAACVNVYNHLFRLLALLLFDFLYFLSAVNSSTAAVIAFIPFLLPTRASIIKILQIKITRMAIHLAHFGTKKLLTWYISPKLQNRINDHL